ncbi:polyketide cyclase [Dyella halodurans]|uniref:Polyketide cyclase n=1 Tax=Dyella halodurans TaxID=1920171 RepID=A0ABV9C4A3_9GAMM|nr:polyketide cyclase [Dyella halodurans]
MMRVLEFIVALIIVAVVAVVVGLVMPGSGHVERSLVVGKDMRQVYDVLNNLRRFPEYSVQRQYDRNIKYDFSGKAYGPGAELTWTGSDPKVGSGKLTIASADPSFDKVDSTAKKASIVWNVDNDWRGNDKHFTLDLDRQGSRGQLTKITWSYDVDYGFNLINRYANLYIHGDPDAFIQFTLNDLQNVLASVQNVDYSKLIPYIEQTQPTPMLLVSSSIERKGGLEALNDATDKAVSQIQAAAKKLGVNVVGPRVIFTTNYGDQTYTFDVGMPISATSLNVAGQTVELAPAKAPDLATTAEAGTSANAAASTPENNAPGGHDRFGRLIVDDNVRAFLAFGGPALKAVWNGTAAGVPQTRDLLKAYAQTHGYKFDEVVNRFYDIEAKPEVKQGDEVKSYAEFDVYLPLSSAPDQTPEQEAGIKPPSLDDSGDQAPAASGTAAAPASASTAK